MDSMLLSRIEDAINTIFSAQDIISDCLSKEMNSLSGNDCSFSFEEIKDGRFRFADALNLCHNLLHEVTTILDLIVYD